MSSPKIILWTAWICYDMSQTTQKTTKGFPMEPGCVAFNKGSSCTRWHLIIRGRSIGVITKIDIMDQGTDAVKMSLASMCCGARVGDLLVSIVVGFCTSNLTYVHYWNPSAWVESNSFNRWWWISNDHRCSSASTLSWKLGSKVQWFWQHLSYAGAVRKTGFQSQVATRREPPPLPRLRGEDIPLRWSLDWGLVELTIARPWSSWWLIYVDMVDSGKTRLHWNRETARQQHDARGQIEPRSLSLQRKFCWLAAPRGLGYVGVKMRNQQENTGEGRVFWAWTLGWREWANWKEGT